ncbi:unnamed protein product, partial [marine sediment metagenome]
SCEGETEAAWPQAPEIRPQVPAGEYRARVLTYDLFSHYRFTGDLKLHLHLKVLLGDDDPRGHVVLTRFLNYYEKPGSGSDYYKEWVKANGGILPSRRDRMSPAVFRGKTFAVRVVTVKNDRDRDPIEGELRYSKVGKLLRLWR